MGTGDFRLRRWLSILTTVALFATAASAVEKKGPQPGVILTVERKTKSRVQYYVVNTPVTTEDPYFEMEVDSGGLVYTVEYEPRSSQEVLPDGCAAGEAVKVRVDGKHTLFVQCLDSSTEIKWSIEKKTRSAPDSEAPKKP